MRTSRDFGAAIRQARRAHDWSQAQLAARAGVGRPWLSELETGKRTAELGRALAVLDALDLGLTFTSLTDVEGPGVDLDELIDRASSDCRTEVGDSECA